jgi:hypothetical protein
MYVCTHSSSFLFPLSPFSLSLTAFSLFCFSLEENAGVAKISQSFYEEEVWNLGNLSPLSLSYTVSLSQSGGNTGHEKVLGRRRVKLEKIEETCCRLVFPGRRRVRLEKNRGNMLQTDLQSRKSILMS